MKTIGIISAVEEEIIALKRKIIIEDTIEKANMIFCTGYVGERKVILVKCGNGKVNAAVGTQILVDLFDVEYIINTGVAGGMHPDITIGDIIVSSDTVDNNLESIFFEMNNILVKRAESVAKSVLEEGKVVIGRIASGDQFVGSMNVKGELSSTFTTYCAEMEGAAIAHACFLNQVPFVAIRTISDKADQSGDMNFEEFVHLEARNTSRIVEKMIELL